MSASSQSIYPLLGNNENRLVKEHSALGGLARLIRWTGTLCLFVLIIDFVFVVLVWETGTQRLSELVATERSMIGLGAQTPAGQFIDNAILQAHEWVFVKSGIFDWISGTRSDLLSAIIGWTWTFIETAVLGLQLFVARLAVLFVSLPFFLVVGLVAITDGLFGWLMRRTHGDRESGFIYHRAKRAFPTFVFLLWLTYLLPPTEMNPRWVIPPFVVLFGIALRLRVKYFKKYV